MDWSFVREAFQTVGLVTGGALGVWRGAIAVRAMMSRRKWRKEHTWPVLVDVLGLPLYVGWRQRGSYISVVIQFKLEPRVVPVEIQAVRLWNSTQSVRGPFFDALENDPDAPSPVGRVLVHKVPTAPMGAAFEIYPPMDGTEPVLLDLKLQVHALNNVCETVLGKWTMRRPS
jgi:hypothetical protein